MEEQERSNAGPARTQQRTSRAVERALCNAFWVFELLFRFFQTPFGSSNVLPVPVRGLSDAFPFLPTALSGPRNVLPGPVRASSESHAKVRRTRPPQKKCGGRVLHNRSAEDASSAKKVRGTRPPQKKVKCGGRVLRKKSAANASASSAEKMRRTRPPQKKCGGRVLRKSAEDEARARPVRGTCEARVRLV